VPARAGPDLGLGLRVRPGDGLCASYPPHKYYVTELGRTAITMGLKLKELVLIPELARALA